MKQTKVLGNGLSEAQTTYPQGLKKDQMSKALMTSSYVRLLGQAPHDKNIFLHRGT